MAAAEAGTGDPTLTSPPAARFYDASQIGYGSFIGGPLAGCWFLSRNWKQFGDEGTAFRAMLTGWVVTAATAVGVVYLPEKFPDFVIPAAYTAIFSAIFQSQQRSKVDALKAKGAKAWPGWKAVGLSFLWLAVTLVFMVGLDIGIDLAFPGFLPLDEVKTH